MTQKTVVNESRRRFRCALCSFSIKEGEDWLPTGNKHANGKPEYAHAGCFVSPIQLGSGSLTTDAAHIYAGHIHGKLARLA